MVRHRSLHGSTRPINTAQESEERTPRAIEMEQDGRFMSRRAAGQGRAQLLSKKGAPGRMQRPPELVPRQNSDFRTKFRQDLAKI